MLQRVFTDEAIGEAATHSGTWELMAPEEPQNNVRRLALAGESEALVTRFLHAWACADIKSIGDLLAGNYANHSPMPGEMPGVLGAQESALFHRAVFSGLRFDMDDLFAACDRVVARTTMHGRHVAEFMGVPPTGYHVSISGIHIFRIERGRIAERWGETDNIGLLQQLGALNVQGRANV